MRAHHLCLAMNKSSSAAVSCSRLSGIMVGEVVGGGNVGGEVLVELEYEVPVSMGGGVCGARDATGHAGKNLRFMSR